MEKKDENSFFHPSFVFLFLSSHTPIADSSEWGALVLVGEGVSLCQVYLQQYVDPLHILLSRSCCSLLQPLHTLLQCVDDDCLSVANMDCENRYAIHTR